MLTTLVHQHLRIARRALRLFALAAITAAVSCSGAATNRPKQHPFLSMQQHPTLDDKTGIIQGIVGDERTGDRLAGATIIAKAPGLEHQETAISDDNGEFVLQHLTPGAYNLDIYYADLEQHESHVTVGAGEITLRWLWFDTSKVRPESVTSASLEDNYVVEACGSIEEDKPALVDLYFGVAFSNACFLGGRPCAPTIARTDYPAFGTSSIWRFNPFAGLHQR